MPRLSKRFEHLRKSKKRIDKQREWSRLRYILDMEDEFMDDLNILRRMRYERECNQRYLFCPNTYKARHAERYQKLHCFLETDYYYTDTEFKEHF